MTKLKCPFIENREEWEEVIRKSQNGMKQGVTSCFSRYSQEITLNNYNRLFIHNIMLRMEKVIKVKDIVFDKKLFVNYL